MVASRRLSDSACWRPFATDSTAPVPTMCQQPMLIGLEKIHTWLLVPKPFRVFSVSTEVPWLLSRVFSHSQGINPHHQLRAHIQR